MTTPARRDRDGRSGPFRKDGTARRLLILLAIILTLPVSLPYLAIRALRRRRARRTDRRPLFDLKGTHKLEGKADTNRLNALRAKLWGGFGAITAPELAAYLADEAIDRRLRAMAGCELARWQAAAGDHIAALAAMEAAEMADPDQVAKPRARILHVDLLIRAGKLEAARRRLAEKAPPGLLPHMTVAASNLALAEHGAAADGERLALLNGLYREAGLAPLKLRVPDEGLCIDNLMPAGDPAPVEGPRVSVLMPVYRAEAELPFALASILGQSWRNLEIVLVDDASPDGTWAVVERFAAADNRIRAARNERNLGAYATRNRALALATGDYVTVHDSDDWSHPELVASQMRHVAAHPEARGVFAHSARVTADMAYQVLPTRPNPEAIRHSYPSFLMRRADLLALGGWDDVTVNGDDELVKRFRTVFGKETVQTVAPVVPLTFQLCRDGSLTHSAATSLASVNFGVRRTYTLQAEHWHARAKAVGAPLVMARQSLKKPFPIPQMIAPRTWPRNPAYDLVLVSDLSLLGGTRRCNQGYLSAAREMGLRVGLYHYPRWDLRLRPISPDYLDLAGEEGVDLLVPEESLTARLCIVHHPPILRYPMDAVPKIACDRVSVLVNQSPMQLWSEAPTLYDPVAAGAACRRMFGQDPVWTAISPRVLRVLETVGGYDPIWPEIWYPPHLGPVVSTPRAPRDPAGRAIVIGRHSRDHWTKWPASAEAIRAAYCADDPGFEVQILGGAEHALAALGRPPRNWQVHAFDTLDVADFLDGLDLFVNFMNPDYIEEFGRNTMEAMARGVVAVVDPAQREIFGEAALYCAPEEVAGLARQLVADPDAYRAQAQKGLAFIEANCAPARVRANLARMLG